MDAAQAYDAVPYHSKPFDESHPDRLYFVGRLLGLEPPPVRHARVLELGCASGSNLLPIALRLPQTTCVGVDISGVQIQEGQALVEALGLQNCTLIQADLTDLGDIGTFDYVIAHGLWSWVPPAVQDAVLALVRRCLAPEGLAYVSYNTFPGWYRRGMVREMCRWHVRDQDDIGEQVEQARSLVSFLVTALKDDPGHHAEAIRQEAKLLQKTDATYMTHGLLAPLNEPCWYHEMAARVRQGGLAIVGDAELAVLMQDELSPDARAALAQLPAGSDRQEQLADMISNRTFRRSILAHPGTVAQRPVRWSAVLEMHASTLARAVEGEVPTFRLFRGGSFSVRHPLIAAAMGHLSEVAPRSVPFMELLALAQQASGLAPGPADAQFLAQSLLTMMTKRAVTLVPRDLGIASPAGQHPMACPLVRERARRGLDVPSMRHVNFNLGPMDRQLVQLLDGTADRAKLLERLEGLRAAGALTAQEATSPLHDPVAFRAACEEGLTGWLDGMARAGFLVA
jgi:SAM-dependent methyltransferase